MKADYFSWCPWVVSAVYDCAPPLCPQPLRSLNGRPGCSGSIELPTSLSPSLSPLADDETYAYRHSDASSTSPSAPLKPKGLHYNYVALYISAGYSNSCSYSQLLCMTSFARPLAPSHPAQAKRNVPLNYHKMKKSTAAACPTWPCTVFVRHA